MRKMETAVTRWCAALLLLAAATAPAQEAVLRSWLHFYGDNTEFASGFRDGDTLFGIQLASAFEVRPEAGITLTAGAWADRKNGSDEFFDVTRPVLNVRFSGPRLSLILGSYFPEKRHGFLEPLEDTRLEFTRPLENGFQLMDEGPRHRVQLFLNWQRYATAQRREIFDSGLQARRDFSASWAVDFQIHSWHQGGQVSRTGLVLNNNAAALGLVFSPSALAAWRASFSLYTLGSRTTPQDAWPLQRETGHGLMGRAEVWPWEHAGIYVHYWDGRDFTSFEGDPSYNSQGMDPTFYERKRTYGEAGVKWAGTLYGSARFEAQVAVCDVDQREYTPYLRFSVRLPVDIPLGRIPMPVRESSP